MPKDGALETEIVMRLTQFERQLARVEAGAIKTANKADKALATIGGKSFDQMANRYVAATTRMQQNIGAITGIKTQMDSAAESARAFEAAFAQQDGIERLRASLDPAYADLRRYEAIQEQVRIAVASGAVQQAQANQVLALAEAQYRRTGAAAQTMDTGIRTTGAGMNAFRSQVQNASFQIGDVAVQMGAGTSAAQALGQQLPQLLGGFGLVGALMGTVAAIAIPLGRAFFASGEEAKTLDDHLKALATSMSAFDDANQRATAPIGDLFKDYGAYAEQAAALLDVQRQLAYVDASSALSTTAASISATFGELERLGPAVKDLPAYIQEFQAQFGQLRADNVIAMAEALGITTDQAILLAQQMVNLEKAQGPEQQAAALRNVIEQLEIATGGAFEMDEATKEVYRSLLEAEGAALRLAAVDIASGINSAVGSAASLTAELDRALGLFNMLSAADAKVYSGRGGDPRKAPVASSYERNTEYTPLDEVIIEERRKLTKSSSGGGRGGGGKKEEPFFQDAEKEIEALNRRIEMVGKTDAQIAALTARYDLLNEAKKRGLDLDKVQAGSNMTLRQEIDAQAASIGRLTQEYEGAAERAEFLNSTSEDLKNGFLDAVVEGENLSGVLAGVAKALARAALEAAIFNSGPFSRGGGGLGGLIGGLFGRASGGGVRAGEAYRVNEASGRSEVFVPSQSGAVLNTSQAQKAISGPQQRGAQSVAVEVIGGDLVLGDNGSVMAQVRVIARQASRDGATAGAKMVYDRRSKTKEGW